MPSEAEHLQNVNAANLWYMGVLATFGTWACWQPSVQPEGPNALQSVQHHNFDGVLSFAGNSARNCFAIAPPAAFAYL